MKLTIKGPLALFGLSLFVPAVVFLARSQVVQQVTATNPKYPEFFDPPYQSQLRQLVQGSKAETLPDSRLQIFDAKVQTFQTNGQTELVIEAPQCIYDRNAHTINSAGPLHAQTGDGKFMIDGTGFELLQTNGILTISNRVHTFVQSELLQSRAANSTSGTGPKIGDLEIASQRFVLDLTNSIANYIGDARVSSTNLALKGGTIVIVAPIRERQLESITVETNVVMDYEKVHVEGDHATYTAQTGIARVTGKPKWRSEDREGHGEELVVDPTNKVFRANGQAYLKFSALAMAGTGFMPVQRAAATNATPVTNRIVEISSDFYEIHTNSAKFGDRVALTENENNQGHGTLDCCSLNVTFRGTNELEFMIAETNVVIRQETTQLAADVATYTAATGNLELQGKPSWQSGQREGKGDFIVVSPQSEQMLVRSNAWMRVPAKELGESSTFAPDQPVNLAGLDKPEQFAELFAEEYTFKPNSARFNRHVRIIHPHMNWTCEKVAVDSAAAGGKNVTMLAENSVVFALSSENRPPVHGTCERAEYVYNTTVDPIIDRMELTGDPVIETTNAVVRNAIIILDQTQHKIFLPGQYAMSGTGSVLGTNLLQGVPANR